MPSRPIQAGAPALTLAVVAIAIVAAAPSKAQHKGHAQPYAGQQTRAIKSLSAGDVKALQRGAGWGFAKAAELNGVPGPLHVLELADKLSLTPGQRDRVQAVFQKMNAAAKKLGTAFIAAERALDRFFQEQRTAAAELERLVATSARLRGELRGVHLAAHLETLPILTGDQRARYSALRGYGSDPCAAVPDGHDAAMWRKHNGCNDG
ncbi:MAG: Spy/CpxP family protein refolding chaperone [Pseudomonadota bacterium]